MLEYGGIDMSEGISVNKTDESRKRVIWNCYYFLKVYFRIQPKVCDGCHDLMQNAMSFNDFAIVSIKGNDYRIYFCRI